jgi:glycosyltransferase involved in cell wall biosynthesis
MRVLHLAPLWFPVSPDAQGGIETFLAALIAKLAEVGCKNTLLASGDSRITGELWPVVPRHLCGLMEAQEAWEYAYFEQHQLLLALERAHEFDIVHSHVGPSAYALSGVAGVGERVLHTQHNPVTPDLEWFARQHTDLWFTTVSEFQARKLRGNGMTRCEVIYNGIDIDAFTPSFKAGKGLCFVGRMEWEKGPDLAVQVARALGRPLTIAGPIIDQAFFERAIRPHLDGQIRYVGTVDHRAKNELFAASGCTVLPSRWHEPFGLVAIESMACGTPVVSLANGALPEIIEQGETGFVTGAEDELAGLVNRALALDRTTVRARVGARFDMAQVAEHFLDLYERIVASSKNARCAASGARFRA